MSESDLETAETRLALDRLMVENHQQREQIQALREKLTVSEATAAKLTESLALAHQEAEVFRRQTGDVKLRLEALGVAGGGSENKLEQRLLAAVNDLRLAEDERKKLLEALTGLAEASLSFTKVATTGQPEMRLALEAELRRAQMLLGSTPPTAVEAAAAPATLTDGMVISIKEELGLVVANIGTKQGVAVGMPFQVLRADHLIGTVRVVEVRDRIAGAIIQELITDKNKIKVGDRLKVAARQ